MVSIQVFVRDLLDLSFRLSMNVPVEMSPDNLCSLS
jgi:hypothetical protein